jgi:NAD(P)-dependent dehydrogenase (short-subunit alcohol dehydrogenase family)
VTSDIDIEDCRALVEREYGRLDVLVDNAAIHYDSSQHVLAADLPIVREACETNLIGAWRVAQFAAALMRRQRRGRIVNVSSEAGAFRELSANAPAYRTSKAALNALTVMMAEALRGSGVLVNAVCPGWVATDMGGRGGRPVAEGYLSDASRPSRGAPVPEDPMNSFRPSGNVKSRPLARLEPFFAL